MSLPAVKAVVLGLKPFILIEFAVEDSDEDAIQVDISSGGGIDSNDVSEIIRDLGLSLTEGK